MKVLSKLLLVEGSDDWHVIKNLWKARTESEVPFEKSRSQEPDLDGSGKQRVLQDLPAQLKSETLHCLGIVLDADEQIGATWDAVAKRLREAGYDAPHKPAQDGLVLEHPDGYSPRVGVWLMPDNHVPGMLEDFVRMLIPADDDLAPEVDGVLDRIETKGIRRYVPRHRRKAFIHTWLAWQEDPGKPMGLAITIKYLNSDSPQADPFVAWLHRLFTEDARGN